MLASGIKSKPVYAPLRADPTGHRHLILGVAPGADALLTVLHELRGLAPQALARTQVLYADRTTVATAATAGAAGVAGAAQETVDGASLAAFAAAGVADIQGFRNRAALLAAFRAVLGHSVMGLRVYVAGPESFLGLAMQTALEFNLNQDEIRAQVAGSLARRVRCVHCRVTTEEVSTNIVACAGCGRWLFVRDHYSRRLAAYMGVMVDAEMPGERPPLQEIYT
jgi:hypothetical protein